MSLALQVLSGGEGDKITPEELFKIKLAIDAELLDEPKNLGKPVNETYAQAANAIREIVTSDLSEGLNGLGEIDFEALKNLEGVGLGLFKQVVNAGKKVVNAAAKVTQTVVNKVVPKPIVNAVNKATAPVQAVLQKAITGAANVADKVAKGLDKVVMLPSRAALLGVLQILGGKAAPAFLYAFLPDNHPILSTNAKVRDKRNNQLKAIKTISEFAAFDNGTILKHLRNGIVKKYKKSPEAVLNDMFGGMGLAALDWAAIGAAALALLPAIPPLIKVFKKNDVPSNDDKGKNDPDTKVEEPYKDDSTKDDDKDESAVVRFLKSPVGIITTLTVTAGLITIIVMAVRSSKKGKK